MLNHVTIMGRLTRDPELRRTGSGVAVASFTVAVDRDFGGKDGEKETDFFDCVAWRATGEFVAKYFTKGRMIVVDGRLQSRNWTDKEGNKRHTVEVVADNCYFGDSKKDGNGKGKNYNSAQGNNYQNNGAADYSAPVNYGASGNNAPYAQNYDPAAEYGGYGGYGGFAGLGDE